MAACADALSITDQAISHGAGALTVVNVSDMLGTARTNEVTAILELIVAGDRHGVIEFTQEMASRSVNYSDLLASLQRAIHAMSMFKVTGQLDDESLVQYAGKLSAEWLQVAYQILLIGTRDLRFAPDHRIGFEMTMLRLLDFEPVEAYPVSEPSELRSTHSRDDTSPQETESSTSTSSTDQDSKAVEDSSDLSSENSAHSADTDPAWAEIVENLEISIELKQGLYKTELVERKGKEFVLRTSPSNESFWTDSRLGQVEGAIQKCLEDECTTTMLFGDLQTETPGQRISRIRSEEREFEKDLRDQRKRERQERIDAAQQELEQDAFVQALKREFGAQVGEIRLH